VYIYHDASQCNSNVKIHCKNEVVKNIHSVLSLEGGASFVIIELKKIGKRITTVLLELQQHAWRVLIRHHCRAHANEDEPCQEQQPPTACPPHLHQANLPDLQRKLMKAGVLNQLCS